MAKRFLGGQGPQDEAGRLRRALLPGPPPPQAAAIREFQQSVLELHRIFHLMRNFIQQEESMVSRRQVAQLSRKPCSDFHSMQPSSFSSSSV